MIVYELVDLNNETKKFRVFNIKPTYESLIKVVEIDPRKQKEWNKRTHTYTNISFDRVYEIYDIRNTNQIIIKDDINERVHLYPSQYQVVEEITDQEFKLLKQNQEMLLSINKLVLNKRDTK